MEIKIYLDCHSIGKENSMQAIPQSMVVQLDVHSVLAASLNLMFAIWLVAMKLWW